MKRFSHFLIVIAGAAIALFLSWFFIQIYLAYGVVLLDYDKQTVTLFKILIELDYEGIGIIFAYVFAYMLVLDTIVVIIRRSWKRLIKGELSKKRKFIDRLSHYWFQYRKIHILFILLTIFITLSISAPSMLMNTFTAVVSISVLVSNLTKKIGTN